MRRRAFLQSGAAAFLRRGGRPNILMIVSDQLNAAVLSTYGGPVPTPNLDRLARRGVVFRQATCVTPFCSPTRASIITGLYPHTHGIVYNVGKDMDGVTARDITTEGLLHDAGYSTYHCGKWHLAGEQLAYYPPFYENAAYAREMEAVFSKVRSGPRNTWMKWSSWALPVEVSPTIRGNMDDILRHPHPKAATYFDYVAKIGRLRLPVRQIYDVRVADRTVQWLRDTGSKPFMATCSFLFPHDPNVVPSPYYEQFSPERISLPANYAQRESRFENDWSRAMAAVPGKPGVREFLRVYYGMVRLVDDQVGRVLDALETTGKAENTVVVFTADHGDMAAGHGMLWKATSAYYDEVSRVPLLISFPKRIKPGTSDLAASHVDLAPTLLELAGHPVSRQMEGQSLAPYLLGGRDPAEARPYSFCERVKPDRQGTRNFGIPASGTFMVRGKGFKYAWYAEGEDYLYDLRSDPGEVKNLARDPHFREQREEMIRQLDTWLAGSRCERRRERS